MQIQQVVASFLASSSLFSQSEQNDNEFAVVRGKKVISNGSNFSNGSNSTSSSVNGAVLASGNVAVAAAGVAGLAAFLL